MLYNIGKYIRMRRTAIGKSQEELVSGICAQNSLSRIERGERVPKIDVLSALLQRLGLSKAEIKILTDGEDIEISQLKFNVRQAFILGNYDEVENIIKQNSHIIAHLEPISRQSFDIIEILIHSKKSELADYELLEKLESILRVSYSDYSMDNLPPLLTYEEILLLNNMAVCYDKLGDRDKAINILYHIKNFYDSYVCDLEEALRTQPMVLYNLSKYLGLSERWDEAISICKEGIKLAIETGRSSCLASTYYNLSCDYYGRSEPGDVEASLHYMKLAYYTAISLHINVKVEKYAHILFERYGLEI